MIRLRNSRGVVVNVDDAKAVRLGSDWVPVGEESPAGTGPEDLTVSELKAEIRRRNEDRADDDRLPLVGSKAELIAALECDGE